MIRSFFVVIALKALFRRSRRSLGLRFRPRLELAARQKKSPLNPDTRSIHRYFFESGGGLFFLASNGKAEEAV